MPSARAHLRVEQGHHHQLQSLECWYQRESGLPPSSPVEEFYAEHYDDAYMEHRFQSMTITPEDSARA